MYTGDREGDPLFGVLTWEHAHFGIWREHRGLHGHRVRMRRNIIWQDQYGRLAIAHEIACHGEDEVGIGAIHLGQKYVDSIHRDVGPALDQSWHPVLRTGFI